VNPQKITLGEMREMSVRGLLIYCSDYHCSHWTAISGDRWHDNVRLSDLEPLFVCQACGTKGADLRPDFEWTKHPRRALPLMALVGSTFAKRKQFSTMKGSRAGAHHREVITMSTLVDFKHWHDRAKLTRSEADKFGDGNEKRARFSRVAEEHDRLANHAERLNELSIQIIRHIEDVQSLRRMYDKADN
jgi:hypothetical protein